MSVHGSSPPDPQPVLDGLRDFQRRTVDYVFDRFYGDDDPTRRFLVADEVGLGKTLVARGVVARAVEAFGRSSTNRSDRRCLHLLQPGDRPPERRPAAPRIATPSSPRQPA